MKLRRRRKKKRELPSRAPPAPARPQPETTLRPAPTSSSLHHFTFPPSHPTSPHPPLPCFPSATCRESNILQLPSLAVPLLPFLFHKITEAGERGGRGTQPADPAVLSNDSMRRPARRTLAHPGGPLVLHRFRFLLSLGAVHPYRAKP